ncbi:MAG: hypothetical protein ACD_20C00015G0008 [uncultured bacterium]|nr:MAG: hypothetical protein ACD_20C00015G0008 [uncultured bacterium]HBH19254.1 hypothetical protein [Cyanobacteria bacterium UBA9579]
MSIGPKDLIDKKLVQLYTNVRTNNFDVVSAVDPERIMNSISLIGLNNKAQIQIRKNDINPKKIA